MNAVPLRLFSPAHDDFDRVNDFLHANPSGFLKERETRELLAAVDDRRFIAIEHALTQDVVAIAGTFLMSQCDDTVVQIGTARVADTYQRMGLHSIMLKMRLLRTVLQMENVDIIYTVIRAANSISIANCQKAGFVPWALNHEQLRDIYADVLASNETATTDEERKLFMGFQMSHMARHAEAVLAYSGDLTQKGTGKRFTLTLDTWLTRRPDGHRFLKALVDGTVDLKQHPYRHFDVIDGDGAPRATYG